MKYKLAIIDSHPIQYRAPLFKKLANHPLIDLTVYYCSRFGARENLDPGFNLKFKWDIPLLDGYRYNFLKNYFFFSQSISPWGLFNPDIIWELKKGRFDAVIIYGYFLLTNWLICLAAPFLKIPVFFTGETIIHRTPTATKNILLKLFFHNVNACLYGGTKSLEFYEHLKIPKKHLFFTPCSVDNDFFINQVGRWRPNREQVKEEIGIHENLPVIMYASKFLPRKKPQDALKAFEKICTKAALVFIGEGKLKHILEDYTTRNKIKNVFFLGFKNQTELPKYYAIADIFVFPSGYETWGLAVNEAMCAGLPIITTDRVSAAYDLVRDGKNGYVLKVGDIEGLAKYLENLILNAQKRKDMGLESLKIISEWNYDICIKGIIDALESENSSCR